MVKNWTPDWIEATGTWFGAIATVLTLLWAVRSFRSDQAERERSREEEHRKEVAAAAERERQRAKEANNVSVALQGGGGYGRDSNQVMDSVHVVVQNHSKYDAVIRSISVDPALTLQEQLPAGFRVPAGESFKKLTKIEPVPARPEELSGKPMDRFTAYMSYRLDGTDWKRTSNGNPEPD
ncbi:hypothetical protein MOD31_11015 [Paenarthrobacter sp. TYUT067]|uniref:hypothetical protein n=1 Tax=Paenarthrobacter sp. TYUT067 TaxID=2926245 RepID=UPI00202F2A40|nr:hypothetical protein [Paenarthrobacter sp. TYUT067]MCM0616555.1 hypothetical protein [Paenarthrobacter sp. TYUT067]